MQTTKFYINGYRTNGGDVLSFEVTTEAALKAIELGNSLNGGANVLAKIKTGDHIWFIEVESVTTIPAEELLDGEDEDEVLSVFIGDVMEFIPDWNSRLEAEQYRQDRLNEIRNAWDKIEVENDPIKFIRSFFGSHDLTSTLGYLVSGKPFKTYDLSMAGNFKLGYKGANVDVEFGIDRKIDKYIDKLYDALESWAVYEDFVFNLTKKNTDLELKEGARLIATYGITDNVIRGKVEDLEYGVDCGFEHRSFIKYGVKIELDICNRYLNNVLLERIIEALASTLDITIPPLVEVLK